VGAHKQSGEESLGPLASRWAGRSAPGRATLALMISARACTGQYRNLLWRHQPRCRGFTKNLARYRRFIR
jgi:hypothetical protein